MPKLIEYKRGKLAFDNENQPHIIFVLTDNIYWL